MPSQGPNSPAAAVSQAGSNVAWANPTNAEAQDAVYSIAAMLSTQSTNGLFTSNYGFSFSASSTITNVSVAVWAKAAGSGISFSLLQLSWSGGADVSNDVSAGTGIADAIEGTYTFAGDITYWGSFPSASQALATDFGVLTKCACGLGVNSSAEIDYVSITITYTSGIHGGVGPSGTSHWTNDATVGSVLWVNPGNAGAPDGNYASVTLVTTAISEYLLGTQFGFTVPTGATILGITVAVYGFGSNGSTIKDSSVVLFRTAAPVGTDHVSGATMGYNSGVVYQTYGSDSDLWGTTWTPAQINDSTFGFAFSVVNDGAGTGTAFVDWVTLRVSYSIASNQIGQQTAIVIMPPRAAYDQTQRPD